MNKSLFSKLVVAFLATAMLAACSSKPDDSGVVVTDADMMTTQRDQVSTFDDYDLDRQGTGPRPGSQQDLVVNIGDRVFYGYDQHELTAQGRETLERQAEWLKRHSNLRVTIEGHADERGTREYNLALGERRAQSARNYLVALGISASRITTLSYGKERPAATGSNEAAWSQNRRAVTVVE